MEKIHGTCVCIANRGVLIRGPSGSGKSDLALRLIDRGAELVSDDYCDLELRNGDLLVSAPPTIAGQMEVRGVGIVRLPHRARVKLGLIVDLAPNATIERLPDKTQEEVAGVRVRWIGIDPTHASAAAKVRIAANSGDYGHE